MCRTSSLWSVYRTQVSECIGSGVVYHQTGSQLLSQSLYIQRDSLAWRWNMGERAAVLRSCGSPAESDNSCPPLSVFLCGVCTHSILLIWEGVCVCARACTVCFTCTRWLCVCVCLCVEYLFDLCLGLRLIMSADRWFQVYLVQGTSLLPLGMFFVFIYFFQSFVCDLALMERSTALLFSLYVSVSVSTCLNTINVWIFPADFISLDVQVSLCNPVDTLKAEVVFWRWVKWYLLCRSVVKLNKNNGSVDFPSP